MNQNKEKKENKSPSLLYLDEFLLHLKTKNYSSETIYNYERDLKTFENFLKNEMKIDFEKIDKRTILQYKAYLISQDRKTANNQNSFKKLEAKSINRMLSSLRGYLKYLIKMDLPSPLPPSVIELMKTEKKHPRVAEFEDLIKLIESPTLLEKNKIVALRNRTMLEVLFSTGLRISELLNIKKTDIDPSGRIFVRGKGKKERFVYLTKRARKYLRNYLEKRNDSSPYLFVPLRGKNVSQKEKKISPNYLEERVKKYRQLLGLNIPITVHGIRHAFATYLAERGASPVAIQILLGHESL
ncbi:MAG: tyrosine-type recombinase/integrase, partial [Minisyncoccales bacterium]